MKQNKDTAVVSDMQFCEFTQSISGALMSCAIEEVKKSEFSVDKVKDLTVDIMEKVSDKKDTELMNSIAAAVDMWKSDDTKEWKMSLINFARTQDDIVNVYAGKCEGENEFVIVMEDSASDNVLDYNEFGFQLAERYSNIKNFMVIDEEEFEGMEEFFSDLKKIYQRG